MATRYQREQGNWGEKGSKCNPKILLSYEFLDVAQGQTLRQWKDDADLLLKLNEMIATLNKLSVSQAITEGIIVVYNTSDLKKFTVNNMPINSKWNYPRTLVKKDVTWCKIRLGGARRIIGYMDTNIFYIIFLDKNHDFYPWDPD